MYTETSFDTDGRHRQRPPQRWKHKNYVILRLEHSWTESQKQAHLVATTCNDHDVIKIADACTIAVYKISREKGEKIRCTAETPHLKEKVHRHGLC